MAKDEEMMIRLIAIILAASMSVVSGQSCASSISETDRRDCYPWSGANQSACEDRGCQWCESATPAVPFCFYNDDACPSAIVQGSRVDCHPEPGVSKASCVSRGCAYCPVQTAGVPWCFYDDTINQGGSACPVAEAVRIDCSPSTSITEQQCLNKGCYWCPSQTNGVAWCFTPVEHGYTMIGDPITTAKGYRVTLQRLNYPSWFGDDIQTVQVDVEYQEDYRLRIKMFDPSNARFEVPSDVVSIPSPNSAATNPQYSVSFVNDPSFAIVVERVSTGEVVFDTSMGGLQFAHQFLQFSTRFPSSDVYGFGETEHYSLRHDLNHKKWGMWGRDEPVGPVNIYGTHPFYATFDSRNNMMGALILNSNAQEVELLPAPGMVYRTIGGILDIYLFFGPQPEDVMQQYHSAIGFPVMPIYWSLGFHLSRYGFNNLDNMKAAVDRTKQYDIPLDCLHGDIDTFDRELDFTYDPVNFAGLPEYVREIKRYGTKFVTILDPPISTGEPQGSYPPFDEGDAQDVWTKESDGVTNAQAYAWPEDMVYFPDYFSAEAQSWWINQCLWWHNTIEFDGIWLDMNEPASFTDGSIHSCYQNRWNIPPFKPYSILGDKIYQKTLCLDYLSVKGIQYDTHNLYGVGHAVPTVPAIQQATGTRGYIICRSTFPGSGRNVGKWLGDNSADWVDLKNSIIGSLEFNMFGIPFVGPDICGFYGDSTEALCQRWMELGAFYTFSRSHNGLGWADHDPGIWPSVAQASRKALHIKYHMMPFMYTLFHNVHIKGGTVMRPLFNEFPSDVATHGIDRQFLWGPTVLVCPVLTEATTSVDCYFPTSRWYDYYTGAEETRTGQYVTVPAPLDTIPVYLRGGYIIPTQDPANCTQTSRLNPMGLIVPLDSSASARGELFWDDGEGIDTYESGTYFKANYTATQGSLTSAILHDGYTTASTLRLSTIKVLGAATISTVLVNGSTFTDWTQSTTTKEIVMTNLNQPLNTVLSISWS